MATFTVSNQRRLPRLNTKQVFLLRVIFSSAQSFSSAENRFNSYLVVDGLSQSLFTTEIFFRGLHRDMAQQLLDAEIETTRTVIHGSTHRRQGCVQSQNPDDLRNAVGRMS